MVTVVPCTRTVCTNAVGMFGWTGSRLTPLTERMVGRLTFGEPNRSCCCEFDFRNPWSVLMTCTATKPRPSGMLGLKRFSVSDVDDCAFGVNGPKDCTPNAVGTNSWITEPGVKPLPDRFSGAPTTTGDGIGFRVGPIAAPSVVAPR